MGSTAPKVGRTIGGRRSGRQVGPTRREPLAGSRAGERTGRRCTVHFESGRDPVEPVDPGIDQTGKYDTVDVLLYLDPLPCSH